MVGSTLSAWSYWLSFYTSAAVACGSGGLNCTGGTSFDTFFEQRAPCSIPDTLNRTLSRKKTKSLEIKKAIFGLLRRWPSTEADEILSSDDRQRRALRHTSVGCADRRIDLFIGGGRADVEGR